MALGPVLIVDDNEANLKVARVALESDGYEVHVAADGGQALDALRARRPRLILMDVQLPGIDGLEVTRRLKADEATRDIVVIAVTAYAMRGDRERALQAGCDGYISKPLDPIALPAQLAAFLERAEQSPTVETDQRRPLERADAVQPSATLERASVHTATPAGANVGDARRILFVDDDPMQRKLGEHWLAAAGFVPLLAADGAEALRLARQEHPSAIVSDVLMPGMDGFSLCLTLRRDREFKDVPLLLMSGHYEDEFDVDLAKRVGAIGLFRKDTAGEAALPALVEALRGSGSAREKTPLAKPFDREGLKDFWDVYLRHVDAVNDHLMQGLARLPGFAAVVQQMPPAVLEEQRKTSLELMRRALLDDEWTPLLENQRSQGETYAALGVSFSDWYRVISDFHEFLVPRLVEQLVATPDRLAAAIVAMDGYLDVAMGVIGDAYIERKERIVFETNAALRASEVRKTAILERSLSAIISMDHHGKVTEWNAAAEQMFGYTLAEARGQSLAELIIPAGLREAHRDGLRRYCETGEARVLGRRIELTALRRGGEEFPVELSVARLPGIEPAVFMGSLRDLTALKRSEGWFQQLVEAAPNATVVVDVEGRIKLVNRATEQLFGYERKKLMGEPIERLLPDLQHFQREGVAHQMGPARDLLARHEDGSGFPVAIGLAPIHSPEGPSTLASIIDLTARKQIEDELRRSNADLEQFAYVASHDLQEPLRMVANYTELLAERCRGKLDEKADKYIHYASDGARRMQRLVSDLLAYSRVGSQGKALVPLAVGGILESMLASLDKTIRDAGAVIEVGELPTVLADEVQLRQLFQNLIGNAIKFRSEAPPRIAIGALPDGAHWQFSVADNGIGMEMQYADRIFQMFQRLHELGKYEGSGIGLAIARRIVERHGGRIWVESQPGAGTTFHFTLQSVPGKGTQ